MGFFIKGENRKTKSCFSLVVEKRGSTTIHLNNTSPACTIRRYFAKCAKSEDADQSAYLGILNCTATNQTLRTHKLIHGFAILIILPYKAELLGHLKPLIFHLSQMEN